MCVTVTTVVSRQWAKVEDKYAVTAIGVATLVDLWTAIGAIKAYTTQHICFHIYLYLL